MGNDLEIVKQKLRGFIRKYYKNQIIRGLLISGSVLLVLLLLVNLIEYYSWSGTVVRTALFYGYVGIAGFVMVKYVIIPFVKLFRIGPVISNKEAARIIGKHFPEVDDKLVNTLQLEEELIAAGGQKEVDLLLAGVQQKAAKLKPVPFKKAIDLKKNMVYFRYLLPPVVVIAAVLIISPSFITEPSSRIIKHQLRFEKPLPYEIHLLNDSLTVLQHENFTLKIAVTGDEVPAYLKLSQGSFSFRIPETKPGEYSYTFRDVESDIYFTINTEEYQSDEFHLKVRPKPVIYNINVGLHYPSYLKKQDEQIVNAGDLVVPEGTVITWNIYTKDTKNVFFIKNGDTLLTDRRKTNVFTYKLKARKDFRYTIYGNNDYVSRSDSMNFYVELIKDEYPLIELEDYTDDKMLGYTHFSGLISDDHGFHSLNLFYRKDTEEGNEWNKKEIKIDTELNRQYIQYTIRAEDFGLTPGENMSYYFVVKDNDVINGYKATKTKIYAVNFPTEDELLEHAEEKSDDLKKEMKEVQKEIMELADQMDEIRNNLFEKKDLNWMDKQQVELMLSKEEELLNKIEELKELNKQLNELEKMRQQDVDPELARKLKELEKLFNELMDEEMKKELEKMKKELQELDKDKLNEFLEQMKQKNEELKNSIDQNLEMLKQLEFEKKVDQAIKDLEKLAEKQKQLAKETEKKQLSKEEALNEQKKINDEFEKVEDDLKTADSLNKSMEEPMEFQADTASSSQIKQDLNDATSKLEKGKQKKASESQQNAGEKMEQMAGNLSLMLESAMMSRMGEDAEQIKKMLDNLLDLSFEQEKLITEFGDVSLNDPRYMVFADKQKLLQEDFRVVNDSLIALSKRQMAIQPFILKESGKIIDFMNKSLISMQERKKGPALGEQQYVMTSMNNLALMLDESLDQMKQSMSMMSGKPGKGKCNKPGGKGSKPSLGELLEMQKQLNQGMGKGKKQGKSGQDGMGMNSEQLARMAAMQAEIRRRLQDYMEQLESETGNGSALNKIAEEMEKVERDIINKKINNETIKRQKDLEVRLLRAKEAELKRERDKKRESREGKNKKRSNQIEQLKYKDIVITQEEILKQAPIEMSPYYKELLKKYLYKLERENGSQ